MKEETWLRKPFRPGTNSPWIIFLCAALLCFASDCKREQESSSAPDGANTARGDQSYALCPSLNAATPRPVWTSEPGWLPYTDTGCTEMAPAWRKIKIHGTPGLLKGCNYFVTGAPETGKSYSSRFAAKSPYYEAWFGAYIIPPVQGEPVPVSKVPELGVADGQAWLYTFGDPRWEDVGQRTTETTCIEPRGIKPEDPNCKKWRIDAVLYLHVDTGSDNPPPPEDFPALWTVPAEAWNSTVKSYQDAVMIPIQNTVWYLKDGTMVATYFAGISLKNLDGATVTTPDRILAQMVTMNESVSVAEPEKQYNCPTSPHSHYTKMAAEKKR